MRFALAFLLLLFSPALISQELVEFQNGQVADANVLNSNFLNLETRINGNALSLEGLGPDSLWKYSETGVYFIDARIGVGTETPQGSVEIVGNWNEMHGALTVRGDKPTIKFESTQFDNSNWLAHVGSLSDGGLEFFYGKSDSSDWGLPIFTLAKNGRVGVGSVNPRAKLEVVGNWDDKHGALTLVGDKPTMKFESTQFNTSSWLIHVGSLSNGGLEFFKGTSGSSNWGSPKLTIATNGNVGINNTNPASKLSVDGLPSSPPDDSGNAGVVCVTNEGNFWLDSDGNADCQ